MGILRHPVSSENPSRFSNQLRNVLASKRAHASNPFDVWSIPDSVAVPQDEDCPYDMDTQSDAGESHVPMDEDTGDGAEAYWAMETQSVADHGPEAVVDQRPEQPLSMDKCVKCLKK